MMSDIRRITRLKNTNQTKFKPIRYRLSSFNYVTNNLNNDIGYNIDIDKPSKYAVEEGTYQYIPSSITTPKVAIDGRDITITKQNYGKELDKIKDVRNNEYRKNIQLFKNNMSKMPNDIDVRETKDYLVRMFDQLNEAGSLINRFGDGYDSHYSKNMKLLGKYAEIFWNRENMIELNSTNKLSGHIIAERIREDVKLYVNIRGALIAFKRVNTRKYKIGNVDYYNAIFTYPEYLFKYVSEINSIDSFVKKGTYYVSEKWYIGRNSDSFSDKTNDDKLIGHNLRLINHQEDKILNKKYY